MASGKKSKESAARALRRAASRPVERRAAQPEGSPRALAIGAGIVVVVAVAIGLAIAFTGGSSGGVPRTSRPSALPQPASPARRRSLRCTRASRRTASSSATRSLRSRWSCTSTSSVRSVRSSRRPSCRGSSRTYIQTGKVRLEIKPWAFIGPDSTRGQKAMFAAAKQNKAFEFSEVLYINQGTENTGWLNDAMIVKTAESVNGLNVPKLLVARNASAVKQQIADVSAAVLANNVNGTPTVFVGRNGAKPQLVGVRAARHRARPTSKRRSTLRSPGNARPRATRRRGTCRTSARRAAAAPARSRSPGARAG